jgi:hypothetical protein
MFCVFWRNARYQASALILSKSLSSLVLTLRQAPEDRRRELLLRPLQRLRDGEKPGLVEEWWGWSVESLTGVDRVIRVIVIWLAF